MLVPLVAGGVGAILLVGAVAAIVLKCRARRAKRVLPMALPHGAAAKDGAAAPAAPPTAWAQAPSTTTAMK